MADPSGAVVPSDGDVTEPPDEHLETFKPDRPAADNTSVNDGIGSRPRMDWNSVTDAGGAQRPEAGSGAPQSEFQFDLGGALSRLGLDAPTTDRHLDTEGPRADSSTEVLPRREPHPSVEPLPTRQPVAEPLPTRQPSVEPLPIRQPSVEPLPTRQPVAEPLPTRQPTAEPLPTRQPPVEPLPTRQPPVEPMPTRPPTAEPMPLAEPVARADRYEEPQRSAPQRAPDPTPSRHAAPGRSVFDERAAVPTLPSVPTAAPPPAQAPAAAPTLAAPIAGSGSMPTLPAAVPSPPPSVAAPVDNAPSTPDIHALRSAQMRANRNQRQGKLFGRTLLAFLVLGAMVAAALLFGRSYLFTTEWDPTLTPVVDEIQQSRGADFSEPVALVVQPADEYAATVLGLTVGTTWTERLPEWRALGLAGPDADAANVGAQLAAIRTAVYDPSSNTIYQMAAAAGPEAAPDPEAAADTEPAADTEAAVDPEAAAADLRFALESAYAAQLGSAGDANGTNPGFAGVSSIATITQRSIDRSLVPAGDPADVSSLPIPIAYEVAAIESLGTPLLTAARVDPGSLQLGDAYPDAVDDLLDDRPTNAATGLLQPGERALADPVALGDDDWALVWAQGLPATTVSQLSDIVNADSYRPIDRDGNVCFVAVFQAGSDADGTVLFDALVRWAADAPVESQAIATLLGTTRVQLEACDPGAAAVAPDATSVSSLINRQIERLAL